MVFVRNIVILGITGVLALNGWSASESGAPASEAPAFFIADHADAVSPEDVAKVKDFVSRNLAVALEEWSFESEADDFKTLVNDITPKVPDRSIGMVILVDVPGEDSAHSSVNKETGVSFIHVSELLAEGDDEKTYLRIERLVMRSLAFLAGFDESPDPFAVTAPYNTVEQLDKRGRNFSPPDTFKFQKLAKEKGVPLVESAHFYMAP